METVKEETERIMHSEEEAEEEIAWRQRKA